MTCRGNAEFDRNLERLTEEVPITSRAYSENRRTLSGFARIPRDDLRIVPDRALRTRRGRQAVVGYHKVHPVTALAGMLRPICPKRQSQ